MLPKTTCRSVSRCALLAFAFILAPRADASIITYVTPLGSTAGGQPVDATVTLTTSANDVLITLRNLQANPTSDIQSVNGISFTLSSSQTAGSIFSSSALMRTITGNGAGQYSDAGPSSTNWLYNQANLGVEITNIGNAMAKQTLVGDPNGSNAYAAANPSIAGSVHNPFLAGTATFDLHLTGVTAASTITALQFEFGTSHAPLTSVTGQDPGQPLDPSGAPEPSAIVSAMSGIGLISLWSTVRARRRRAKSSAA
jgi:hypothetical protein